MKKILYAISSSIFLIDQIIKLLVMKYLPYGISKEIIPNFFSLTYVKNTGGAFSILAGNVALLSIIGIVIFIGCIYYIEKNPPKNFLEMIATSSVVGGLLGNLVDRIFRGGVIDFLDFQIFNYNFPVFNIADVAIVLGIFALIIIEARSEKHESRERKHTA